MPWAGLDDGFHEDPRILEAGLAAAGLYACATTYCARHLTDGFISEKAMRRLLEVGNDEPLNALIEADLVRTAGDKFELVGYGDVNPPREVVEERRRRAKERAAKGGRARAARARARSAADEYEDED